MLTLYTKRIEAKINFSFVEKKKFHAPAQSAINTLDRHKIGGAYQMNDDEKSFTIYAYPMTEAECAYLEKRGFKKVR